ncbi:hypothetical protein LFL96_37000 (plasmid) [Paraburkholderia sp. D15]|nr:hypothetical protein [Paraburkholderia sp. D15]WGS55078.1 hypothetical protein LFL96_37000 [Paraburkholderia sp. D15]
MDTLQLFHAGMLGEPRTWVGFLLLAAVAAAGWYAGVALFDRFHKPSTDE